MTLDRTHVLLSTTIVSLYLACVYVGMHLLWNTSPSLPLGAYWRLGHPEVWERGMLVELSPPDAALALMTGPRQGHVLLKRLVGVPGDVVCWTPETMAVNGRIVAGRHPASPVKVVHDGCRTLRDDEGVVMAAHRQSVDSRDLGPVALARVRARVVPILTWRGE